MSMVFAAVCPASYPSVAHESPGTGPLTVQNESQVTLTRVATIAWPTFMSGLLASCAV